MCNVTNLLLVIRKHVMTAFHKVCNVTYLKLLVIGKDVMRLPSTECATSLTSCLERCDETVFHKIYTVTHLLLIIGKDDMRLAIAFHKMCDITHNLLVIGKDVMRLPFTRCAMSLTSCWP
jgi:hypothetical protein